MARIRSIKPEFPEDETLGTVTRDARLTYVLLWTRADDLGRFRAAAPLLRGLLFPYDDDVASADVERWLQELVGVGRVQLYEVDGQRYGLIVRWAKHQRIDNAGRSTLPDPPTDSPPSAASLGEMPPVASAPDPLAAGLEGIGGEGRGYCGGESLGELELVEPEIVEASPPATRRRDPLFDAVVAVCGLDPTELTPSARGACNRALADLRAVQADPGEVPARAAVFRSRWDVTLTPTALAKHWAACAPESFINQPKVTNNQAALMRAQARGA